MVTTSHTQNIDPLLVPFVRASNESRAQTHLEKVLLYADSIISEEVQRHVANFGQSSSEGRSGDDADLREEAVHVIIGRIAAIRYRSARPITNLIPYIHKIVYYLCRKHFRDTPIELNFSSIESRDLDSLTDLGSVLQIEQRNLLQSLWAEICELPESQRTSLLCNFRDKNGANALPLLALCRIVSPMNLAGVLGVPVNDLENFFEHLPMEDSEIAQSLGMSAQEVTSSRLAARRRLKRRIRTWLSA